MKNFGRLALATVVLVLSASCAWSAVTIHWVDATGPHDQDLANVDNPNYVPSDPLNIEEPYVWFGALNISMAQAPIQFSVTGNFIGELGELWPQVRIEEHVTNLMGSPWDKFTIDIVNDDGGVYVKGMIEQNWHLTTVPAYAMFTATAPEYYIQPNDVFDDTMHFYAVVPDPDAGDGTLTFTKTPHLVPEVGGVVVLLSGGLGIFTQVLRKRRA